MQHVLSAEQFSVAQLEDVFDHTDYMRTAVADDPRGVAQTHIGRVVATLFYEPSTRTRLSFESAAQRLGASIISTENAAEFSSTIKGETLEDTIRVVDGFADVIIMRHKENDAAERAAAVSSVPIVNGGAGTSEHPTQALLDLYTIRQKFGRTDNLNMVIGGDLRHGRTARSLARLAKLYQGNRLTFVSTPELGIGDDMLEFLTGWNIAYQETEDLSTAMRDADVVYWTRLQKERLADPSLASHFAITQRELALLPRHAIIMHPLPRNEEIHPSVDADPRAVYFAQAKNGLYVRMALLDRLLNAS